jgi:DnaA family protein
MSQQLALRVQLRDSSVFGSFYAADNRPVVDALLALPVRGPPPCVFLHGAPRVGKTHLLQALCALNSARGELSAYVPLRELSAKGPEILQGHGHLACVCIDDLETIASHSGSANAKLEGAKLEGAESERAAWERALFGLHQQLEEQQGHLVLASTLTPVASGVRLRDLASRLSGGLVLTVRALDDRGRVSALQLRARLRGCELPDDTAQYLLRRLPRDMAALCDFLDRLDSASLAAQRRLTIPFVREVLATQPA